MVLCLLVYRLAEYRMRTRLAETDQTFPNQLNKPTSTPTMRWIFHCFEGIDLLAISTPVGMTSLVLHLRPVHEQVLMLLGPPYQKFYQLTPLRVRKVGIKLRNVGYKAPFVGPVDSAIFGYRLASLPGVRYPGSSASRP